MSAALNVRPRVWIGLAIYVGYLVVVFSIQLLSGVRYDELGKSGSNLFFGAGLSLIIATVLLALTTSLLGWWRPALFERHRSVRWPIIAPILMAVALVFNLISTDWAAYDGAFFAASLVILLVGFTEEITTRGLLLTGLRSRLSEVWVWLLTSVLFGAMHLLNATGQALGATIQQVVFAFIAGTVFYIVRRVTGTLIWAMVLHGLWDFSTFAVTHGTPGPLAGIGAAINLIAGVFALIAVAFVIRGADERHTPVTAGR
ncbi:CPBP family intramembrane glutamic endopeptidase [Plantibacter flavus]|uniref:CPBP family intramembrane glutamic endopeptidase n=1 Tax=Plantibacter flavus TaxID=150123 RepID=UPI003F5CC965